MSTDSELKDRHIDWKNEIFDNRYILLKKMGYGSYASVWISYDVIDKKYYAIKINNRDDYDVAIKETNTYNAIKICKSQYIMNIIRTFDHINDGKHHCVVMELMACSMYDILKKHKTGMSFKATMECVRQILEGLKEMHKNKIIHGDVKPENILIGGQSKKQIELFKKLELGKIIANKVRGKNGFLDTGVQKKVIKEIEKRNLSQSSSQSSSSSESNYTSESEQFSISTCESSDDTITESTYYDSDSEPYDESIINNLRELFNNAKIKLSDLGNSIKSTHVKNKKSIQTCYYRSPEILLGLKYDESSDIWALGCMICELLTGKILFDAESYKGNTQRHHLYLIIKKLGMLPYQMMKDSPYKDVYFTTDLSQVKGYKKIDFSMPIQTDLKKIATMHNLSPDEEVLFTDLIMGLLKINPSERLTAKNALMHQFYLKQSKK